jgi:hypothetical protein
MQQFKGLMYYYEQNEKQYNKRFLVKSIIFLFFLMALFLLLCYLYN